MGYETGIIIGSIIGVVIIIGILVYKAKTKADISKVWKQRVDNVTKNRETFYKVLKKSSVIFTVIAIISVLALHSVKLTYYLEPVRVAENEIISIKDEEMAILSKLVECMSQSEKI